MTVHVADTRGPEIILPASAENMTVIKGGTVSVPVVEWEDYSGEVEDLGYQVLFDGSEVAVTKGEGDNPDTFAAEEYGEYVITYTAQDKFGNESAESIIVECARTMTLADFNADPMSGRQRHILHLRTNTPSRAMPCASTALTNGR